MFQIYKRPLVVSWSPVGAWFKTFYFSFLFYPSVLFLFVDSCLLYDTGMNISLIYLSLLSCLCGSLDINI